MARLTRPMPRIKDDHDDHDELIHPATRTSIPKPRTRRQRIKIQSAGQAKALKVGSFHYRRLRRGDYYFRERGAAPVAALPL